MNTSKSNSVDYRNKYNIKTNNNRREITKNGNVISYLNENEC